MDIQHIKKNVLQVFKDCKVNAFPISCTSILKQYQTKLYRYSFIETASPELYHICQKYSQDAFTFQGIICYNDSMPDERIRFSLMHELGHAVLSTENETYANQFASHILIPRSILIHSKLTDTVSVSKLFCVSKEAASYALLDIARHPLSFQTDLDRQILNHFYDPVQKFHIYHSSECPVCGSTIYNSIHNTCIQCKKLSIKSR
ncbi:MAG: ImmA/IrrE family metallo-endopeptidase [Clostridium sp.]|nr:ImmA/IrrE family metallo-endopeptidase [Clostridium sp.]